MPLAVDAFRCQRFEAVRGEVITAATSLTSRQTQNCKAIAVYLVTERSLPKVASALLAQTNCSFRDAPYWVSGTYVVSAADATAGTIINTGTPDATEKRAAVIPEKNKRQAGFFCGYAPFAMAVLPTIQRLAEGRRDVDVRIIFWFDW